MQGASSSIATYGTGANQQHLAAAKLCLGHLALCSGSVLLHREGLSQLLQEMQKEGADEGSYVQTLATISTLAASLQHLLQQQSALSEELCQKRARTDDSEDGGHVRDLPLSTSRGRTADAVLAHGDLVQHVMSMLAGPSKASRVDMGRLSLVCRLWRDMGRREAIWRPVVGKILPALETRGGADVVSLENGGMGYRSYLQDYGRSLLVRRVYVDDPFGGLDLHVEVWDEMDGAKLSSKFGPAAVQPLQDTGRTTLYVVPDGTVNHHPITAASRDPQQHRFSSFEDFIHRAHETDTPSHIRMKVVVRNRQTGTMALLWESGKERKLTATSFYNDDDVEGIMVSTRWLPLYGHSGSSVRACGWFIAGTHKSPAVVPLHKPWSGTIAGVDVEGGVESFARFVRKLLE